jgi:predicted dehydrogenase
MNGAYLGSGWRSKTVKFLVVGLGSMGKRRIRNLQYLRAGTIIGFDIRDDRAKEVEEEYKIRTFINFDDAMKTNPDALIISTPPDLHAKYARIAAMSNKHFFTEVNVVDAGLDELINLCKNRKTVAAPSCTMRFNSSVKRIKEVVDKDEIGRPLAFTYHSGQYLPDWHPWEDYRKFYVAKRETGAAREIVSFELVWLTWIFGGIKTVSCFCGKTSILGIDIDDIYQVLMKFKNGVFGHMQVDVVSRVADRSCKIFGEKGVIFWNLGENVRVYAAKDKQWRTYQEKKQVNVAGYDERTKEEQYIEEMKQFIKAIKKEEKYPYTLEEDRAVLQILYAAEESSHEQAHVKTS